MKFLSIMLSTLLLLIPFVSMAETEEEEMARMQRELNSRLFNDEKPARPAPVAAPEPAPVAAAPAAPAETGLPESTFTGYSLIGVSIGMGKSDVLSKLQAEGYTCNHHQAAAMLQATGRNICILASTEAPKIAMFSFAGDRLRDFELHEQYQTGFPEEIYKRAKSNFMSKYGSQARCKNRRRGEICEVFGHGYRISLRSEMKSDEKAAIVRHFGRM